MNTPKYGHYGGDDMFLHDFWGFFLHIFQGDLAPLDEYGSSHDNAEEFPMVLRAPDPYPPSVLLMLYGLSLTLFYRWCFPLITVDTAVDEYRSSHWTVETTSA